MIRNPIPNEESLESEDIIGRSRLLAKTSARSFRDVVSETTPMERLAFIYQKQYMPNAPQSLTPVLVWLLLTLLWMQRKKCILVVEDDVSARKLITLVLGEEHYDIAHAATGYEAIDQVNESRPDLIIMDLELPGIGGDEVTARLKADPTTRDIPVIVTTVLDPGHSTIRRAIAAGALQVLYKPTPHETLEEEVRRCLSADEIMKSRVL